MKIKITKPTNVDFNNETKAQGLCDVDPNTTIPTIEELRKLQQPGFQCGPLSKPGDPTLEHLIPKITIGIDLGDREHRICVLNQLGAIEREYTIVNTREAFEFLVSQYPDARFVMEVGTHSPWISALLAGMNCEVIVGNARKLKAISAHERKCDELDARTLARIGRMDLNLLYPVKHVSQNALKDRLVISSRENLVSKRKELIQSIRGSVKTFGKRIDGGSPPTFPAAARIILSEEPEILATLEPTLLAIEQMNQSIKELDKKIEQLSIEKYPVTALLRQIQGVGPITALAFILAVEDPARIDGTRDIGAYFGLVPRRDQSGEVDKQLGISKTGNPYMRKLLTQCAQYILGAHGPDCDLKRYGLRRAEQGKGGTKKAAKGAKKKAITAVARKLSVLLLSLWRSGAEYDPFRNSPNEAADATA